MLHNDQANSPLKREGNWKAQLFNGRVERFVMRYHLLVSDSQSGESDDVWIGQVFIVGTVPFKLLNVVR